MKLSTPQSKMLIAVSVLLASNVVTGLVTRFAVRAQDFSEANVTILENWGRILAQFEDVRVLKLPHVTPQDEAALYGIHEDNARFLVHYPKFCHRQGLDQSRALTLFCWAVAADSYHSDGVDIQADPAVWRAFLADGPKDLPMYWDVRRTLTDAGAGQGLIRGEDSRHRMAGNERSVIKMEPLSTPYKPLPGEGAPL